MGKQTKKTSSKKEEEKQVSTRSKGIIKADALPKKAVSQAIKLPQEIHQKVITFFNIQLNKGVEKDLITKSFCARNNMGPFIGGN